MSTPSYEVAVLDRLLCMSGHTRGLTQSVLFSPLHFSFELRASRKGSWYTCGFFTEEHVKHARFTLRYTPHRENEKGRRKRLRGLVGMWACCACICIDDVREANQPTDALSQTLFHPRLFFCGSIYLVSLRRDNTRPVFARARARVEPVPNFYRERFCVYICIYHINLSIYRKKFFYLNFILLRRDVNFF